MRDGRSMIKQRIFSEVIRKGEAELEHLARMNQEAAKVNGDFLKRCLSQNAETEYGKKYDFRSIGSYSDYAERVPITGWEDVRPWADLIAEDGKQNVLFQDDVACFYFTSGTTGQKKRVPCSKKAMATQNRYLVDAMFGTIARELGDIWSEGGILLVNESGARFTKAGFPVFNISGRLINTQRKLASFLYVSPTEAMLPSGPTESMTLHALAALADPTVSDIESSFVVFPVELMQYIESHWAHLAEQIATGTLDPAIRMPAEARKSLTRRIRPNPERARRIEEVFRNRKGDTFMPELWPGLQVISAGTAADFGFFEHRMRAYAGDRVHFYHRGYTSSEGIFTIPESLDDSDGVLLADAAFYEFRLEDGRILTMDQLSQGMQGSLIVTTESGLYRYDMQEKVKVTGFSGSCPRLRLLGRERKQLDITGEKLDLPLVNEAVERACEAVGTRLIVYTVYPDRTARPVPRYEFYLEIEGSAEPLALQRALTAEIRKINEDLDRKFDSGKIGLPVVNLLPSGTWSAFMQPLREQALSEGRQIKPICLLTGEDQAAFFRERSLKG